RRSSDLACARARSTATDNRSIPSRTYETELGEESLIVGPSSCATPYCFWFSLAVLCTAGSIRSVSPERARLVFSRAPIRKRFIAHRAGKLAPPGSNLDRLRDCISNRIGGRRRRH